MNKGLATNDSLGRFAYENTTPLTQLLNGLIEHVIKHRK